MSNELMRRELKEAIDAGERALTSLREAQKNLDSAGNWGFFDMLGGGMIASMVKHQKMNNATMYMEDAKRDLNIFKRELQDVSVPLEMRIDIGSFLSFADFFFDGFLADYLVQSKINDAKEQVRDAIRMVESIMDDLKTQYNS